MYASNIDAGEGATMVVAFPVGQFTVPPIVSITTSSGRIVASFNSVKTSGFTICADNWSQGTASGAAFSWTAVQATDTSVGG